MTSRARRADETYEQYRANLNIEAKKDKLSLRGRPLEDFNPRRTAMLSGLRKGSIKTKKVEITKKETNKEEKKGD